MTRSATRIQPATGMKVVTRKKVTVSKVEGQHGQLEARGPAVAAEIEVAQPGAEVGRRRRPRPRRPGPCRYRSP